MALNHEDFVEIKKVLDDRYVQITDCGERQESVNKRFANDDKRIDKLTDSINIVTKLLWAITSSVIGVLVVALLNLIIK